MPEDTIITAEPSENFFENRSTFVGYGQLSTELFFYETWCMITNQ